MFDYPYLEVLRTVEREGNLERAAKSQSVTKSALSQTLATLDYRMGAVTLDRKRMRPTRFGVKLCRHLEHVALLERGFFADHRDLFNVSGAESVTLRIGVPDDAIASWLTEVVCRVRPPNQALLFDIEVMNGKSAKRAMTENRLCGAVTTCCEAQLGFRTNALGNHVMRAVAAPDFVGRHFKRGVDSKRLSRATLIQYAPDDPWATRWLESVQFEGELPAPHVLPSAYGIANACLAGAGWAMCSSLLVADHLQSGELVDLIPGSGIAESLAWHVSDPVAKAVQPVTDLLLNEFGGTARTCGSLISG